MFLVREIVHCKPGKVREMVNRFQSMAAVMKRLGQTPFRVMTDYSGEQFWTVIAETETESLNGFQAMQDRVMADPETRQAMSGYHDLVESGKREIYRIES